MVGNETNDFGDCLKCRLQYALDTGACIYGRPKVPLDDVPDMFSLFVNCCLKLMGLCLEHSKLVELVMQDLVLAAIWFACDNRQTL